jgi:tetratricopeptide (TPR) repeat protein
MRMKYAKAFFGLSLYILALPADAFAQKSIEAVLECDRLRGRDALDPCSVVIKEGKVDFIAAAYNNRGNAYSDMGEYRDAIADYTLAIAVSKDNAVTASAWFNRGNALLRLDDISGAIESYDKTLQLTPEHANALHNRGYSYSLLGDLKLAVRDFDSALLVSHDDPLYLASRARAY